MGIFKIAENESALTIKSYRLMTRDEFNEYSDVLPKIGNLNWWLADEDGDDIAYAEGNYTEDDMYCDKAEANTYARIVLDITNLENSGMKIGEKFEYKGYAFTILSNNLAISNGFITRAPYFDEEMLNYIYANDVTCTLEYILADILG